MSAGIHAQNQVMTASAWPEKLSIAIVWLLLLVCVGVAGTVNTTTPSWSIGSAEAAINRAAAWVAAATDNATAGVSCRIARPSGASLPLLNDVESCGLTFSQAIRGIPDNVFRDSSSGNYEFVKAKCCPPRCLDLARNVSQAGHGSFGSVWGSFPYHENSSVCMAAIHAGLISSVDGGWVLYERFGSFHQPVMLDLTSPLADKQSSRFLENGTYRRILHNISREELFPFNSSQSSWSNGVFSLSIGPDGNSSQASDGTSSLTTADTSYTVFGRGTFVSARAHTPFAGRSGHAHVVAPIGRTEPFGPWPNFHVVIGGKNSSHYMQDVWLGEPVLVLTDLLSSAAIGAATAMQWFRLPDAPFTGRAHISVVTWLCTLTPGDVCPVPVIVPTMVIALLGGQTGHHCGLEQLSVCSDESWLLFITINPSSPTMGLMFTWQTEPMRLPFSARCGFLAIWTHRVTSSFMAALIGGQLSYEDSTCQLPITTTNDVWYTYSEDVSYPQWLPADPAPFTPRQSLFYNSVMAPVEGYAVGGGIRFLSHTVNAFGIARLTAAEMYLDIWTCGIWNSTFRWIHGYNQTDTDSSSSAIPGSATASLPVPGVNAGIFDADSKGTFTMSLSIGGRSSVQAQLGWQDADTLFVFNNSASRAELVAHNVTLINQPIFDAMWVPAISDEGTCPDAPTVADIERSRYGLPLSYLLTEEELNDPDGPFLAGSDSIITHASVPSGHVVPLPLLTTCHRQSSQQVQRASDSTSFVYLATSAVNTSRGLFDLCLKRHGVGRSPNSYILSSGQSSNQWYSDWLTVAQPCCPLPNDPSFRSILGNGSAVSSQYYNMSETMCVSPSSSQLIEWRCAQGFHLEPSRIGAENSAWLRCTATMMWMDTELNAITSCVKDRITCVFPEVDLGDQLCVLASPTIKAISFLPDDSTTGPGLQYNRSWCQNVDTMTVEGCPASESLVLSISGAFFTQPLVVLVGGYQCTGAELHDQQDKIVCSRDSHNDTSCQTYGTGVLCSMPAVLGARLPVIVLSGARQERTSLDSVPMVSFAAPRITNITSPSCVADSLTALLNCPHNRNFTLIVQGDNFWATGRTAKPLLPLVSVGPFNPIQCEVIQCGAMELMNCLRCSVTPSASVALVTAIPLLMTQAGGQSNLPFSQTSIIVTPATITFEGCPAGSAEVTRFAPQSQADSSHRCQPCHAGLFSTDGSVCLPCSQGTYSKSNSTECSLCPVNTFANGTQHASCDECHPNSYQLEMGESACIVCDLNQYLVRSNSSAVAECHSCPDASQCLPNGTILSTSASAYLLVEQSTGLVSSTECQGYRCLAASVCSEADGGLSITSIQLTKLSVLNCCSSHRLPASVNPLCGACEEGYVEWAGACVWCDWHHFNWGVLLATLLMGFILLFVLHRLPNDRQSALVSILLYFVQMSLLFFSSEQLPRAAVALQPGFAGRLAAVHILWRRLHSSSVVHGEDHGQGNDALPDVVVSTGARLHAACYVRVLLSLW